MTKPTAREASSRRQNIFRAALPRLWGATESRGALVANDGNHAGCGPVDRIGFGDECLLAVGVPGTPRYDLDSGALGEGHGFSI